MRIGDILLESEALVSKAKGGVFVIFDSSAPPDGLGAAVYNSPRVMVKQSPSNALFTGVYVSDLDAFTQDQDKRTYEQRKGRGSLRSRAADMMTANKLGTGELAQYEKVPGLTVLKNVGHDDLEAVLSSLFPGMDIEKFMDNFQRSAEKKTKRVEDVIQYKGTEITYDNKSVEYIDLVKSMLDSLHTVFDSHGVKFLLDGPLNVTTDKRVTSFGQYGDGVVYLNPLYVQRPGAYITLIHEYGHKLHSILGWDNAEIKEKYTTALADAKRAKNREGGTNAFKLNITSDDGVVVLVDGDTKVRGTAKITGDDTIIFTPLNGDPAVDFSQWSASLRHTKRLLNTDGSKAIVPHSEWLYTEYSFKNEREMFTELFTRYMLKRDRNSESMQWMKNMISLAKK